jgi:ABC-2 type transport system permease protein
MRRSMTNKLSCFLALFRANIRTHNLEMWRTWIMSLFMMVQNLMYFALWIVFFGAIKQVKGWQLSDVAVMYGVLSTSVGTALFVADGARTITLRVLDGSIDAFLTRPRHPLPVLLLSRSCPSSLGDILSGPVLWFTLGGAKLTQLPFLLCLTSLSAVIFLATTIIFYSLAFWLKRGSRFSDQLFETLIIFSSAPQNSQPLGIKILMFSVLPAGFITLLPVTLIQNADPVRLFVLATASVVYAWLAVIVFNAGVRRYVSCAGV